MQHRHTVAVVAMIALAGCSGATTPATEPTTTPTATTTLPGTATPTATTTPPPSPVSVATINTTADTPDVSLSVRYNATTQWQLPTDPPTLADSGQKWLVVRMDITNTGSEQRAVTGYQYIAEAGADRYEPVASTEDWALAQADGQSTATIGPGETVTRWLVFQVPTDTTDATLQVRENTQQTFAVRFAHDPSLTATPDP